MELEKNRLAFSGSLKSLSVDARVELAHREFVSVDFGLEEVLLDKRRSRYYGLNPVARLVFSRLQTAVCVRDVVQEIVDHYGTEPQSAADDVLQFLLELRKRGLITILNA